MRSMCNQKKKMNITLGHSSSYEYPEKKRGSIEELHKQKPNQLTNTMTTSLTIDYGCY